MRTVTFSDPEVVRQLNESFVCAWVNKRPTQKFKDGTRAARAGMRLSNGKAPANVTSVFAAPDGTVIHAMAGSQDANFFKTQIAFAKDLRLRMYEGRELRAHGEASYVNAHTVAQGVKDPLVGSVHKLLARRMRTVTNMPLDLFDRFEDEGPRCADETVRPIVCGLSAIR